MLKSLVAAAALSLIAGGAFAQAPATNGPQNRPVNTNDSVNRQSSMPVKGANSFTEGEAKSRIEKMGFTNVSGLKKDDNGVWRGTAQHDGSPVQVWLDYKGNVGEAR